MGYIAFVVIVAAAVSLAALALWLNHIDDSGEVRTQPLTRRFYRRAYLAAAAFSVVSVLMVGLGPEWVAITGFTIAVVVLMDQLDRARSWYYGRLQEPPSAVIRAFSVSGMPPSRVVAAGPEDDPGWSEWANQPTR